MLYFWYLWYNAVAGDEVKEDDIHLIMEYKKGDKWGDYKAPRSNRLENPALQCVLWHLDKLNCELMF